MCFRMECCLPDAEGSVQQSSPTLQVVASTLARGHAGAALDADKAREEGCCPGGRRDIRMFAISWPNDRIDSLLAMKAEDTTAVDK